MEEKLKNLEKTRAKLMQDRTVFEAQLNENKLVLEELNLLGPENKVFKLTGPLLIKQDLEESRKNVGERIKFISKQLRNNINELKNVDDYMAKLRGKIQNQVKDGRK